MSFPWEDMTPERFEVILTTYGHYMETRGKDPDTWGMFTFLGLSHRSAGRVGISAQFCNPDGTCDDLKVLNEFIDLFQPCKPVVTETQPMDLATPKKPAQPASSPSPTAPRFPAQAPTT